MNGFTPEQIEALHQAYAGIEKLDHTSITYHRLRAFVASLSKTHLEQIAAAGIPWLSQIAKDRLTPPENN